MICIPSGSVVPALIFRQGLCEDQVQHVLHIETGQSHRHRVFYPRVQRSALDHYLTGGCTQRDARISITKRPSTCLVEIVFYLFSMWSTGSSLSGLCPAEFRSYPNSSGQKTRMARHGRFCSFSANGAQLYAEGLTLFHGFSEVSIMVSFKASDTQRAFPLAAKLYEDFGVVEVR